MPCRDALFLLKFPIDKIYIAIYTFLEVSAMETAKVFMNGKSQAVRLPKSCRFAYDEVSVRKIGDMVVLYPKEKAEDLFFSSLGGFTDDVFESILAAREEGKNYAAEREPAL
jgi:antitoxin VapB